MSCKNIPNASTNECENRECSDIEIRSKVLSTNVESKKKYGEKIIKKLGEVEVGGIVVDDTYIPEGYVEIKGVTKTPVITQCKLVFGNIIVEGYIVKDIRYATPVDCHIDIDKCKSYRNNLKDIVVKVPFRFAGPIEDIKIGRNPDREETRKYDYLQNTMGACDKGTMGPALCEWESSEKGSLVKPPYCELIKWKIKEYDVCRDDEEGCHHSKLYNIFTEKMVVTFKFEVFQEMVVCPE
ncbi:hypothetical protein [Clostridium ihumii]|uniref:hypothetical protein n=1 Tax=Clostridium ihumii TaxID=1470356 RepID=UPI0005590B15|nr:hypothetical protein [Clostridium ihumii]